MFMDKASVKEWILNLKIKNSEGYDRIPQWVLKQGKVVLLKPLSILFRLIYEVKKIPDQWRVAKTIPTHKKDQKRHRKL